jgi:hypothetical protein
MRILLVLVCTLALAGCRGRAPSSATPPPDPPSGALRPDAPIPYATLAEHLSFNTRSHIRLLRLRGQVLVVRGPVWKVEPDGEGAVLHLGSPRGSVVRAHFAKATAVRGVLPGQEVDVVGTFAFRGDHVLLADARLAEGIAAGPAPARPVGSLAGCPAPAAAGLGRTASLGSRGAGPWPGARQSATSAPPRHTYESPENSPGYAHRGALASQGYA